MPDTSGMPTLRQESRSQHPADPVDEALALIQAFADTGATQGADALATREEAVAWLREQGLLAAGGGPRDNENKALVRLRGALRDVLAVQAEGRDDADAADAAARLTKGLADGRLVVTVG